MPAPSPRETIARAQHLAASGRVPEAESLLRAALAPSATPPDPDLASALGTLLVQTARAPEAADLLQRASAAHPARADLLYFFALACSACGRRDDAVAALERSIALEPRSLPSLELLGTLHLQALDGPRAEPFLARALALAPRNPTLARRHAAALDLCARADDARRAYDALLTRFPASPDLHRAYAFAASYADWGDPQRITEALRQWGRLTAAARPPFPGPLPNSRDPQRPLRVGFLCQDIRKDSAIARFIAGPVLHLDRARFDLRGYCTQPTMDQMTPRLRSAIPWLDATRLSDDDLARRLRADAIDILIETAGQTPGNRLLALARRAAPIQITCIGDPRTTGLTTMDYRLVDEITDPPGADALCTETLIRLPGCFLCYEPHDDAPEPAYSPPSPSRPFTFASFNVSAKTGTAVLSTWADILRRAPGSRLLLKGHGFAHPPIQQRTRALFQSAGVDPARLDLEGPTPAMADHLRQYDRVDLALDTFPYCGTTTSCDCLWQSVPFITLRGRWHAARVGASLLTAAGLEDLIADTPADYAAKAASLAHDPARLTPLRTTLRERLRHAPLLAPAHAAHLAEALRETWRRWCAHHPDPRAND